MIQKHQIALLHLEYLINFSPQTHNINRWKTQIVSQIYRDKNEWGVQSIIERENQVHQESSKTNLLVDYCSLHLSSIVKLY